MKTHTITQYKDTPHRMYETHYINTPAGNIYNVYVTDCHTYYGIYKHHNNDKVYYINDNDLKNEVTRMTKQSVINYLNKH